MAGANKIIKNGQSLFRAGDNSDGMYIIRKGELLVYLEQGDKEVPLVTLAPGAMVGEMALFDRKPRSASVKATADTEVTHITLDDFTGLMKQIPKWFVGLMATLSTRLRETNERLQKMEGMNKKDPYQSVIRYLHILVLLMSKDGVKIGRDFGIQKKPVEDLLVTMFAEDPTKLKLFFQAMTDAGLMSTGKDEYNNIMITVANKGVLSKFTTFLQAFQKANMEKPFLTKEALDMLDTLAVAAKASAYEAVTTSFDDLVIEGKRLQLDTSKWKDNIAQLKTAGDEVGLVKTGSGIGIRTNRKELDQFIKFHKAIAVLYKANI